MSGAAFDGQPLVTVYSAEDIGQDAMSWATVEDADHRLHFGANSLISFEGGRWRSDPAGNAYALRGLDLDPSGRIWAAGNGQIGSFSAQANGRWRFHSLIDRLDLADRTVGEMWAAYARPGGAVFAGANTVYWWNGSQFVVQRFAGPRRIALLRSLGGIYVSQASTGLWGVEATRRTRLIPAERLGEATVLWLEALPGAQRWLLATARGFLRAEGGVVVPEYPAASETLRPLGLTGCVRLPDGRLAVATLRGGILLLDPAGRLLERLDRRAGLPTDEIFSLHADGEAGLWATSSANIFRVSLTRSRWFRDVASGDQPCVAIARSGAGLMFATDTGLFGADLSGDHLLPVAGVQRHCWSLEPAGDRVLLGRNGGLDLLADGRRESLYDGATDVAAVKLEPGGRSAIIASGPTLLRVPIHGPAAGAALPVAVAPEAPTSLALGRSGEVWVGTTTQGVYWGRLRPGAVSVLQAIAFTANAGSAVVAGSRDDTVYVFVDRGGWQVGGGSPPLPIRDFPRREVTAAEVGPAGVWVAHPADGQTGVCIAEIQVGSAGPRWVPRLIEGLWRVGIPESVHAEAEGGRIRLWVGGTAGILRCEWPAGAAPFVLPTPRLRLRREDGTPVQPEERLPYAAGELTVAAEVSSYALRPALTVETRIEPVDPQWIPLAAGATRRLDALRDGHYLLRARVRASTGELSSEAIERVTILPPWWRTPAAGCGLAAVTALAGYALHRTKSRALRRRAAQLERAVQGRTQEVERANAEKTRFVAGISHDIRNPLNGIVGLTLALEDSVLDARQRELTAAMRGCAKYLDGLVEEVIDFAQIESGRAELHPEWYGVKELLEEVIAITRADAEVAGAAVHAEVDANLPAQCWGDVGRVRQILVNLTFNAIRHAGGRICLRAAAVESPTERALELSVTDLGPGIAARDQPRLFEPFSRIERKERRRTPGSGLGLATSKRWAEAMGGRIRVTSATGKGSRFTLTLPTPERPHPEPPTIRPGTLRRVLVVEDEDYNAWAIAAVAARVGVKVVARASTGAEALQLFTPGRYDGVLLDRLLPDMDGTQVCRAMRRAGDTAVRIIALTAGATAEDRAACLAAGMDAFIGKPLTPEKLLAVLAALGGGGSAEPVVDSAPLAGGRAFDLRLIAYLSDGTAAGQVRALERYLRTLEEAQAELQLALAANEPEAIRECAHRLHGHFRMIEAEECGLAVLAIERCAQRGELPAEPAVAALADAVGRLRQALGQSGAWPTENPCARA